MKIVAGFDAGTHGVRCLLVDFDGKVIAEDRENYPCYYPNPGWVEQEPEDWWNALKNALKKALNKAKLDGREISAISIAHQRCTIVPVNENGKPLMRAILWNDRRCVEQVNWAIKEIGENKIYNRTGYPPATAWSAYKAMWVRDNNPEIYKKAYKWLLTHDYLVYKLTGEMKTSSSSATMTGILDIAKLTEWARDVIDALGLEAETWPEIYEPGEILGQVSKSAAEELGIPEGIPVAAGSGDQPSGALGCAVVREDTMSVNLGTSVVIETVLTSLKLDQKRRYFLEYNPAGLYAPESTIMGGTRTIDWYIENFFEKKEGVFEILENAVKKIPPGNLGLTIIPYWSSALVPYWDPGARGVIYGFGFTHGKYHLYRAILEGIAFEVRKLIEFIKEATGNEYNRIVLHGGGSSSQVWCQIFADILNKPVSTLMNKEATAFGAAIIALKAAGAYKTVREAAEAAVKVKKTYEPIPENIKLYEDLYSIYKHFYDKIKDDVSRVSKITGYYP